MEALHLPVPAELIAPLWVAVQILLILLAGYFSQRVVARFLTRLSERYPFPPQLLMPLRGGLRWFIMGSALIFVLERLGVSATVLWTALSGFVAVAAIAFFAMWSVLSNLLCAVLIFTVGPFRIGDVVELLDTLDVSLPVDQLIAHIVRPMQVLAIGVAGGGVLRCSHDRLRCEGRCGPLSQNNPPPCPCCGAATPRWR